MRSTAALMRRGDFELAVDARRRARARCSAVLGTERRRQVDPAAGARRAEPVSDRAGPARRHGARRRRDRDVRRPPSRPVGLVFQDYRLFPHLSVLDNVAFGPRSRGTPGPRLARSAGRWLDRLGARRATRAAGRPSCPAARRSASRSPGRWQATPAAAAGRAARGARRAHPSGRPGRAARPPRRRSPGRACSSRMTRSRRCVLADRLLVDRGRRVVQEGSPTDVARRPATDYVAPARRAEPLYGAGGRSRRRARRRRPLVVPDNGRRGAVFVAVRPSSIVVSTEQPRGVSSATPGRRRSRA